MMKPKTLAALLLMAGFGSLLLMNFGEQVGGYMDFEEAVQTRAQAHVVGHWVAERRYQYDPAQNVFRFHMRDEGGRIHEVRYANPKPANFEDAEKLVIEGSMQEDGIFVAEHILVKCPSKYDNTEELNNAQPASMGAGL